MAQFVIKGGKPLSGVVSPIGNKNAVLKMMAASLLTSEPVVLYNVPGISDVDVMIQLLIDLGVNITYDRKKHILTLVSAQIKKTVIDPMLAKKMRSSNVLLGPLLARCGQVTGVLPGGDKIGPREMNAHFEGLAQLGARCIRRIKENDFVIRGTLRGAMVFLYEPSVTATENVLLAAVLTKGTTIIENAACEPHVKHLCLMLEQMGAHITGIGTNRLEIIGVTALRGTTYHVPADFIYIGTMVILAAITKGNLTVQGVTVDEVRPIVYFLEKLGVNVRFEKNNLMVSSRQRLAVNDTVWARAKGVYSQPWPCFPSDMMSLMIVLATQVKGSTLFFEKMYPGRMFFADYLNGMGANIVIADPHRVIVNGPTLLHGAKLSSPDLRAGMAYVAAGLVARGQTVVDTIEHIDRGYPAIETVLHKLGADITRIS